MTTWTVTDGEGNLITGGLECPSASDAAGITAARIADERGEPVYLSPDEPRRDSDGEPATNSAGEWIYPTVEVSPGDDGHSVTIRALEAMSIDVPTAMGFAPRGA